MISSVLDWSEFWATAIPLIVWLVTRPVQKFMLPVIIYLWIALILNFLIDESFISFFENNNHLVYNLLSTTRLFLFMWFFSNFNVPSKRAARKIMYAIVTILVALSAVIDSVNFFNSKIFGIEGIALLSYSILYFLKVLRSETTFVVSDSSLLVITGLSIYESCCFFLFLFYKDLIFTNSDFAMQLWNVHNIVYIVFCLYISRAFFEYRSYEFIKS